jgi:deoxyribodipyrimidine photo-lyase
MDPTPERDLPRALPVPPAPTLTSVSEAQSGTARRAEVVAWVRTHLDDLVGRWPADPNWQGARSVGGQAAADVALATFDVSGYAARRNEVLPRARRGASGLSPYIRHGLLSLPRVWEAVATGAREDRTRFQDELLWQEYARHVYARLGSRNATDLRFRAPQASTDHADPDGVDPWEAASAVGMACVRQALEELETDGWVPNQVRMWLASHWTVRHQATWQDGEDRLFQRLLDGSRAANRLGWQWTVGTGTGRPYGFSRSQVERRAPGLCDRCPRAADCPIEDWPTSTSLPAAAPEPRLGRVEAPLAEAAAGPASCWRPEAAGRTAELVWLTAESLGTADPALAANPHLPAVFVLDAPLLARLRLDAGRLVFLAECLGDLAARRPLEVWRGDPVEILGGPGARRLATTFAPVPGWRRRSARLPVVELHPWPWLRRPGTGTLQSFSAWRKEVERQGPARPGPSDAGDRSARPRRR